MITTQDIQAILDGKTNVVTTDGDKIGSVGQVYLDDVTGEPTWVTVKTGLFGSSESFVPVDDATFAGDELRVPYSKDQVKDAPRVEADQNISPAEEDELYRYYGTQQGTDSYRTVRERDGYDATTAGAAGTAGVAGAAGTAGAADRRDVNTTDAAGTTLHAEDVDIHTRQTDGGKVRLRKYTVTENVTKTVPVTREEVRVERVPAGAADVNEGAAFADKDGEVVGEVNLTNEEVVVDRDVHATERVNLAKDSHTEDRQVTEQVRHEEVALEQDGRDVRRDDKRI